MTLAQLKKLVDSACGEVAAAGLTAGQVEVLVTSDDVFRAAVRDAFLDESDASDYREHVRCGGTREMSFVIVADDE